MISSRSRYDLFDTSPYEIVKADKRKMWENCEKEILKSAFESRKKPDNKRVCEDEQVT